MCDLFVYLGGRDPVQSLTSNEQDADSDEGGMSRCYMWTKCLLI